MTIGEINTTSGYVKSLKRAKRYEKIENLFMDFLVTVLVIGGISSLFRIIASIWI